MTIFCSLFEIFAILHYGGSGKKNRGGGSRSSGGGGLGLPGPGGGDSPPLDSPLIRCQFFYHKQIKFNIFVCPD